MRQFLRTTSLALLAMPALLLIPANVVSAADEKSEKTEKVEAYTLKTCAVDEKALGEKPVTFEYKGHEIKVCNEACKEAFMKDADKNLAKVEKAEKSEKKEEKHEHEHKDAK